MIWIKVQSLAHCACDRAAHSRWTWFVLNYGFVPREDVMLEKQRQHMESNVAI